MNALIKIAMTLILAIPLIAQADGPKCYIYIKGNCPNHQAVPQNSWFVDSDAVASSRPGICMHRASEYYVWCGKNAGSVIAGFNMDVVNGGEITVVGQEYAGTSSVQTFGPNWDPIVTSF